MLTEGDRAPAFALSGIDRAGVGPDGEPEYDIREFSLSELTDDGRVLVAFYPGDFSPVCTEELCSLRNLASGIGQAGSVVGVSRDSLFTHEAFAYEHDLRFPLLSDVDGEVCRAYDAVHDEPVEGRGVEAGLPKRSLYVVDADRTVRYAWQTDDPYVEPDLDDAVERLSA